MRAAAVAYQRSAPAEIGQKGPGVRVPESPSIPAFPLFTQANPLGIQFSIPFSATWSEEETPTHPTHPDRQEFEIENAPEWAKEGKVVREGGKGRVLYPAGQPFGDDHPFRYDRDRRSNDNSDFSDKGRHDFTAKLATGGPEPEPDSFDDPTIEHEDGASGSSYLENEDDDEDSEDGESNEGDATGSDIFSAFGNDNAGDNNYSIEDDPDFKERQALFEQGTEGDHSFGGMADFNERNDGPDFFSGSLRDDQDDQNYLSSEPETVVPSMTPKSSARLRNAQNPFKLYAGEGSAPKFIFDDADLEDDPTQKGEEQNGEAQELQPRPKKQLKEKFMKDREQLEAQLNARGDSLYKPADERPDLEEDGGGGRGAAPGGRRLMGQAELRAQMAMQRIAAAAMRATSLRGRRGKKGKRRGGGMPVVFI